MEDPWSNAWSTAEAPATVPDDDPWKPAASIKLDAVPAISTWEPPAWPDDPVESSAIWNTGASAQEEPSEPSETSEPENVREDEPAREDEPVPSPDAESSPRAAMAPVIPLSPPLAEEPVLQSRSPSPDAFGSFESAEVEDATPVDNAWSAVRPVEAVTPIERSLWTSSDWKQDEETEQDEWAAASARQRVEEERERHFPREAVNALTQQWDELAADLWPSPKDEEKTDARPTFESRLESIPGLSALIISLVPDYHLQPLPQLLKTATFKSMQTSLRMTKSYPMVQASPLSQFYSSKGNSAWESSLKAKEVVKDDWPWEKPQEAAPAPASAPQADKPARAGILSLWNRRPTSMPPPPQVDAQAPSSRTASPAPRPSMDQPRPSIDSVRSAASKDTSKPSGASSPVVLTPPVSVHELSSPTIDTPVDAAPSAMARLFGRFSRNSKPVTPALTESTSDGSMALSASDLSFLSDVVPSTSGSRLLRDDDILGELGASSSVGTFILPPKLPAPLAPPPKAQPHVPTTSAVPPKTGWDFEEEEESFSSMQEGVSLDALLGGGTNSFQQGYAPVSSRNSKQPARASIPQRMSIHTAILPSSILANEREIIAASSHFGGRPLPAPPPRSDTPSRRQIPPPSPLFGGDAFDEFMSSPAVSTPPGQFTAQFASPSAAPLTASPAISASADDDFGDFGDFMSPPTSPPMTAMPPTPRPAPAIAPPRVAPVPLPPSQRRDTRQPEPPRSSSRTPVVVMSRSSTLTAAPPMLAPPPGSSRVGAPAVVMSRSSAARSGTSTPAPLLAPPPGSSRSAPRQNLLDTQGEDLLFDASPASPSSVPSPTLSSGSQQPSPIVPPIRPESRSSLPPAPRTTSPSLFEELARPTSRNSLPSANGVFNSVPLISSPLAPLKTTMSPPPALNGNAFSLFGAAPAAATPPPPTSMLQPAPASTAGTAKQGTLSAADLSFFDSL